MRACVLTQKSEEAPASSASLLATPMYSDNSRHFSSLVPKGLDTRLTLFSQNQFTETYCLTVYRGNVILPPCSASTKSGTRTR